MSSFDPIAVALAEDVGSGDLTSTYFVADSRRSRARIFAKESAVVAGLEVVTRTYQLVDSGVKVQLRKADGDLVDSGQTVVELSGPTRSILTGERVALNFVQRLSGVATLTYEFVRRIEGTPARILDTRKTTPGLRSLEKAAVRAGGGYNHRMGLYDGVIVKDNHLLARPDLQVAINRLKQAKPRVVVEVEADSPSQVKEFVTLEGVDFILLDNMTTDELRKSVALRRPGIQFEASGGVTLETVRGIAETGVDYISIGQLTHSARAIDFSLELLDDEVAGE
jgi:nicotinate-nucleotide pyrophosphorylase (carboxylating)